MHFAEVNTSSHQIECSIGCVQCEQYESCSGCIDPRMTLSTLTGSCTCPDGLEIDPELHLCISKIRNINLLGFERESGTKILELQSRHKLD